MSAGPVRPDGHVRRAEEKKSSKKKKKKTRLSISTQSLRCPLYTTTTTTTSLGAEGRTF
jgi:hypothetical protein